MVSAARTLTDEERAERVEARGRVKLLSDAELLKRKEARRIKKQEGKKPATAGQLKAAAAMRAARLGNQ